MIRINLLGESQDNVVMHTLQLLAAGAVCALALVVCYVHYDLNTETLEAAKKEKTMLTVRVEKLREKTKKVELLEKNKKLLRDKLMTIATLKAKKHGPVHVLYDITQAIPPSAWLVGVSNKGDSMEFQGFAVDPQTVSTFMRKLEMSPYFASVDLIDSRLQAKDGVPLQKFSLNVRLRSALDVKKLKAGKATADKAGASAPGSAKGADPSTDVPAAAPADEAKKGASV